MSKRWLPLTDDERSDLLQAVRLRRNCWATYAPHLDMVHELLRDANLLPEDDRDGQATLGSVLRVRKPGETRTQTLTLCRPADEDVDQGCLSVLEPLGWELLGSRAGDTVHAPSHCGWETYVVDRVERGPARDLAGSPGATAREVCR